MQDFLFPESMSGVTRYDLEDVIIDAHDLLDGAGIPPVSTDGVALSLNRRLQILIDGHKLHVKEKIHD